MLETNEGKVARSTVTFSSLIPCLEILAKRVIYADLDATPSDEQKDWIRWRLRDRGDGIISLRKTHQDPATGFEMAVYQALNYWAICFCGSNDLIDWANNLTEVNVGRNAYRRNRGDIREAITGRLSEEKKVYLVGHSLGGRSCNIHLSMPPCPPNSTP